MTAPRASQKQREYLYGLCEQTGEDEGLIEVMNAAEASEEIERLIALRTAQRRTARQREVPSDEGKFSSESDTEWLTSLHRLLYDE